MTVRFCPDCGAECHPQDHDCRECQFPLNFKLVTQGGELKILKIHVSRWQRIAQILRRNGIQIETHAPKYPGRFHLWWALPAIGALIFLLTILFGGKIVDRIWPAPMETARVLDLNEVGPAATTANSTETPASQAEGGDVDTSFLKQALESSQEQKDMTQDLNVDPQELQIRPPLPLPEIEAVAQRGLLLMEVGEDTYLGTLLNQNGLVICDQFSLNGAFQREKRMVNTDGEFRQVVVFVVPEVGYLGEDSKVQAEKVDESDNLAISLLRAPVGETPPHKINFDQDLIIGEQLYIATIDGSDFVLEERQIVSVVDSPMGISLWTLDNSVDPGGSGAPVYNAQGELVGIYMYVNGQDAVLSMVRLREKAPQLYREILE